MSIKKLPQLLWVIASVAFILNFIWEIGQMPWYVTNPNLWRHLPMCLLATIGDVLIILCLYGLIGLIQMDLWWIKELTIYNLTILVMAGGLTAIGIEQLALATNQWQYAPTMPLLPLLNVGLLPFLQLILLPPITILIARLKFV